MANKAIFLDRDDTLIEDPGYINHPDQVKLIDGVAAALVEFKSLGYKLIVVSNQSAVARGITTEKVLGQIHDRLKQLLAYVGAYLDGIYYCPYHIEGAVEKYRKESDLRKPNPGMLLKAAQEMDIDLTKSWMIGNRGQDIEAGFRAKCKTILVDDPARKNRTETTETEPDYRAINMKEAVNIIKKHNRSTATDTANKIQAPPPITTPIVPQQTSEPKTEPPTQNDLNTQSADNLLNSILIQLKAMQRSENFSDFSIMRLLAGTVQAIVLFCLLISIWFLTAPDRENSAIFITLGFAAVLQLMALTFYMMQGRK